MKKNHLSFMLTLLLTSFGVSVSAATSFDLASSIDAVATAGTHSIYVSNVDDATGFTASATSGGSLIETPAVAYTAGQKFAVLTFTDKGEAGPVTIKVSSGGVDKNITVNLKLFSNPGITLAFYDIVFWQQSNPITTNATPAYSEVLKGTYGKAEIPNQTGPFWGTAPDYEKWASFYDGLTAGADCSGGSCNPYPIPNMASIGLTGFFIPPTTGDYTFKFYSERDLAGGFFLDATCTSWRAAKGIAIKNNNETIGTVVPHANESGGTITSAPVTLTAGKAYPIYSVYHFIHTLVHSVSVVGPGITEQVIPETMLAALYDVTRPATTTVLVQTIFSDGFIAKWDAVNRGTKMAKIEGYNVYVNGVKKNTELVSELSYRAAGLAASQSYDIIVTAVDELGNESEASNVTRINTLANVTTKPGAPTNVQLAKSTGETLQLTWTDGTATGTSIVAYDVYVNDQKYNSDYYFYTNTVLIKGLQPETSYKIEVVNYNASMVASDKSTAQNISTNEFDPLDDTGLEFGEHRARLNVVKRNVSWTEGIGLNADVKDGNMYKGTPASEALTKAITEYKPGILRWGGLDANEYGFENITGPEAAAYTNKGRMFNTSIGKERKDSLLSTHAMNLNYCNEIEAMYSLCVGTKQGKGGLGNDGYERDYSVDYMDGIKFDGNGMPYYDAATAQGYKVFLNLIEYLAGPASSTYGKKRAEEGFEAPLLQKGKTKGIVLEFGNEVWGKTSHNAPIANDNYLLYPVWCRAMADSIRNLSPYWDDIKDLVYFKYSARNPRFNDSYGLNDALIRGQKGEEIQLFGTGGYIGGNLSYNPEITLGESEAHYYRLRQQNVRDNIEGIKSGMKEQIKQTGVPLRTYFYETQVSSSSYFGNLGQAVVLMNYLTSSMKVGGTVPAIFTYGGGEWRISIDGRPLSHYVMAQLINTYCKGHLVESNVESNNTIMVESGGTAGVNLRPLTNYDPVATSVYNNGKQWSILLISRDFDNDYSVQLSLPSDIGTISKAKKFVVSGDNWSIREGYTSTEENVTLTDGQLVYVPKFSMVLYTFEATDPNFEKLPLGYFDRVRPESIELTGDFFINTNKGSTKITPVIEPDDVFSKEVIWEISHENNKHIPESQALPTITYGVDNITVRAMSGKECNGSVWLKATLADNLSVSKSVEIVLSNQKSECEYDIATENVESGNLFVYPNPADDVLYVNTGSDNLYTVTIYNNIGMRVMAETASSQLIEMNVASLPTGEYHIMVEGVGTKNVSSFIKK